MKINKQHLFLIPIIILLFFSCNPFNPDNGSIESFTEIGNRTTIEKLMQNFVYAYNTKDSLLYSQLLDSSFVFEYETENALFSSWGRDEDLKITSRVFRNFERINLNFTSDFPASGDEEISFITSFQLQISTGNQENFLSGRAQFSCKKYYRRDNNNNQIFDGYKIYHWQDLR